MMFLYTYFFLFKIIFLLFENFLPSLNSSRVPHPLLTQCRAHAYMHGLSPQHIWRQCFNPTQSNACWSNPLLCGLIGIAIDTPGVTPLRKMDLPSASSNLMPVSPKLGVGLHVHVSPSMLGSLLVWTCAGPACAATATGSSYVHLPFCVQKNHCFLEVIHYIWLL